MDVPVVRRRSLPPRPPEYQSLQHHREYGQVTAAPTVVAAADQRQATEGLIPEVSYTRTTVFVRVCVCFVLLE